MKFNGNLEISPLRSGQLKNSILEKLASAPAFNVLDVGRIYYDTVLNKVSFNDGTTYNPLVTADALSATVSALNEFSDNITASIGTAVDTTGAWVGTVFNSDPYLDGAASITGALQQLSAGITTAAALHDTLAELTDVTITSPVSAQALMYRIGGWQNSAIILTDVSDVTSSAAELNILDGALLSTVELNYVDGVTSPIQTQLDAKQPLDSTLTALAALNGSGGILVETGVDTFARRSLIAPAAGITVTNGSGVSGNPTLVLANDLSALEALSSTGFAVRTATDTWAARTWTANARISLTNADGVAGNPVIDLAVLSPGSSVPSWYKVDSDTYGRVSQKTAVLASDITTLISGTYVPLTGGSVSGNITLTSGATVTGVPTPVGGTDVVNKNYADALVAGLSWKQSVRVATTGDINLNNDLNDGDIIDGVTLATGDRVLVKNQSDPAENGIYVATASGPASRSDDMNGAFEFLSASVLVEEGDTYLATGWTQVNTIVSIGTTPVEFVQFTGAGTYNAGAGLNLDGNIFDVIVAAGITYESNALTIALYDPGTSALFLTDDGITDSVLEGAGLRIKLDANGGIEQGAGGLYIDSTIEISGDTGSGNIDVVSGELVFDGNASQGVSTNVASVLDVTTITITVADATDSTKGVASFDTDDFVVTGGVVTINPAYAPDVSLDDLTDVEIDTPAAGQTLVYNSTESEFKNKSIYYLYTSVAPDEEHVVTHNLNQKYCVVTVVDDTDEVIIPSSITFDSENQLTVTFTSSVDCRIVVMGVQLVYPV